MALRHFPTSQRAHPTKITGRGSSRGRAQMGLFCLVLGPTKKPGTGRAGFPMSRFEPICLTNLPKTRQGARRGHFSCVVVLILASPGSQHRKAPQTTLRHLRRRIPSTAVVEGQQLLVGERPAVRDGAPLAWHWNLVNLKPNRPNRRLRGTHPGRGMQGKGNCAACGRCRAHVRVGSRRRCGRSGTRTCS